MTKPRGSSSLELQAVDPAHFRLKGFNKVRIGGAGAWKDLPPNPKSVQKLSKKNNVKLVWYTLRSKNYVKIPLLVSDFSELATPFGHSLKPSTFGLKV